MIRTKFICTGVEAASEQTKRVTLMPVNADRSNASPEDKNYFSMVHGGNINLMWGRPYNQPEFVQGQEYFVDFSSVVPGHLTVTPGQPAYSPIQPPKPIQPGNILLEQALPVQPAQPIPHVPHFEGQPKTLVHP